MNQENNKIVCPVDEAIESNQHSYTPPKAVIDAISTDLPQGFKYVYEDDGFCRLDADNGLNIESGKVLLSEDVKKILPKEPTIEQLKQYSYNSQTAIAIVPEDDGCFKINGNRIKAEEIVKAPLKNLSFEKIRFYMQPSPFPEPFEMVFSGNGYDKTLHMQRTPHMEAIRRRTKNASRTSSKPCTAIAATSTILRLSRSLTRKMR